MESYNTCSSLTDFSLTSIMFSWFICIITCINILPSFDWIIFHCVDIPHFVYPFISWRTFGWFLLFGYKWIMLLWTFVYIFLCDHMCSVFLGLYLGMELLVHRWLTEGLPDCFPKQLYNLTLSPVDSTFCVSSLMLIVCLPFLISAIQ